MNDTTGSSWWLLKTPKIQGDSPAPLLPQSPENPPTSNNQQAARSARIWPWTNNTEPIPPEPLNNVAETPKPEDSSWLWSRIFYGSTDDAAHAHDTKAPNNTNTNSTGEAATTGWFLWLSFLAESAPDLESDVEDQSTAELFKEAKQTLESSKDSCHYAISGHYRNTDVELSVAGTRTGTHPVKYNHKKKPAVAHEFFESSMAAIKPIRNNSPPLAGGNDTKMDTMNKNGRANGLRKALASSSQLHQMAHSQSNNEVLSSNSSIKSVYVSKDQSKSQSQNQSQFFGVLPELHENFRVITMTTKIRLLGEAMLYGDKTSERHLYTSTNGSISSKKKKLAKKAVVISLHSFLPPKFVKLVIGQSTGTSSKFARSALEVLESWLDERYSEYGDIQLISLEGFGTIESRAQESFNLLLNWIQDISDADFVFFVGNSIGSPSLLLLAQMMIESERFDLSEKKVGLLSIAGTNLGPYAGLDTKVVIRAYTQSENEIINELFELQKPSSVLSHSIKEALQCLCANNVKVTLSGSVTDQFVPLSSALAQHIRHPNIYRCIYVDEGSDVPLFVINLISVVLTMENVGYGDHNLLWFLLEITHGAIQLNGTHGILHGDISVFETGLRFALETTSVRHRREAKETSLNIATGDLEKNMYHLPWCVRGLLNDLMHIKHIQNLMLLETLRKLYLSWEPTSRHWRSVKHCFAAFEDLTVDEILL